MQGLLLMLATAVLVTRSVAAADVKAEVMAPIHASIDAFNEGDTKTWPWPVIGAE